MPPDQSPQAHIAAGFVFGCIPWYSETHTRWRLAVTTAMAVSYGCIKYTTLYDASYTPAPVTRAQLIAGTKHDQAMGREQCLHHMMRSNA